MDESPEYFYFDIYRAPKTEIPESLRPSIVVDGQLFALQDLDGQKLKGDLALVGACNQKNIDSICDALDVSAIFFSEMRVADLSVIASISNLEHLGISWNTKASDLSFLGSLPDLKSLILQDTPKIFDLSPVSSLAKLNTLEFSGGIWNKNRAPTLLPIASLNQLTKLKLLNVKIEDGSLRPIAKLPSLTTLELANQFATKEFAYLAAKIPQVECQMLAPHIDLVAPIEGNDIMVVGSRKPFLNSTRDSARIAKYESEFAAMVREFQNSDKELAQHPTNRDPHKGG